MPFHSFYNKQSQESQKKYSELLLGIAQTSRLFSSNKKPFIHYRAVENAFCKAFSAINVSLADDSIDAYKIKDGIGLKTFLKSSDAKQEKITEFSDRNKYPLNYQNGNELVKQVISYRNQRLKTTIKKYDLGNVLYHYIVRDIGKLLVCECPMLFIDEASVAIISTTRGSIKFKDKYFHYKFDLSKHTLFKTFQCNEPIAEIKVPIEVNHELLIQAIKELSEAAELPKESFECEATLLQKKDFVVLPLYSTRTNDVPEKSGLNIWNAAGRKRDLNEIYIPIPRIVHCKKSDFFPSRETKFRLLTDDGETFSAKVCQANGKALMTDPNKALGKWLLRKILKIEEGKIVTYEDLRLKGADTVIIYKINKEEYKISLHSFGGFKKEYVVNRAKA